MAKIFGKDRDVDFAPANLMSFGKSFSRMGGQPLDESEVWYDLAALQAYAKTDAAYVGMKVVYVDEENNKVYQYSIQLDGELKEIGVAPTGDDASISVDAEGLVTVFGFAGAENGTVPVRENGKLAWKTLEDIGAGDGNDDTTYNITPIKNVDEEIYGIAIETLFNGQPVGEPVQIPFSVYTKNEVDAAIKVVADKVGVAADGQTGTLYELIAAEAARAVAAEGALSDKIGVKAEGETVATGVYAYVDGVISTILNGVDPDKIDSLNELIAWVEAHPTIVEGFDERIEALEGAVETLNGEATVEGSVNKKIADAIGTHAAEADGKYATKQELADHEAAADEKYVAQTSFDEYVQAANSNYATKASLKETDDKAVSNAASITNLSGRLDNIVAQGGEPNAINNIKVNGVVQTIATDKSVDIAVPTSIVGMEGYSELNTRVTTNENAVTALNSNLGTANTNISNLTERLGALEVEVGANEASRIDALEGSVGALVETVGGHTTDIANLKAKDTELAGLISGNAANITAINNKIGTVTEGKTVVDMINEVAGTIDFSPYATNEALTAEINRAKAAEKVNADAIAAEAETARAAEKVNADAIAALDATLKAALENDGEGLDSIKELAVWIEEHETEVLPVITGHTEAITAINGKLDIEGKVSEYVSGAIAGIPAATVNALGLVKASAEVTVATDGTLGLGVVSTDKLVQGNMTLILDGGDAEV